MKKWQRQLPGFKEIYENSKKNDLIYYLIEIEKKIEKLFFNQELTTFTALSTHRLIYIIEKENISKEKLEKMVYSLAYYFLQNYLDKKELIKLSKMSENELEKESKKDLESLKKSYQQIENKEFNVEHVFEIMKKIEEMHK